MIIRDVSDKQLDILEYSDSRWNISSGAVRSGKTVGGFLLLPLRMTTLPPGNCLLIGKTERTLKRNILNPLREIYGKKRVSYPFGDGEIKLFGRHCYIVGANDERAVTKIQGLGLVYAYGDEITTWPESFFNMLKSRLSEPGAMFDGSCNPEGPFHWLKVGFLDKAEEYGIRHFEFKLDDNPFLSREFVEALKREYTGVWYDRYVEGKWVLADGIIYDMFDKQLHVIERIPEQIRSYYVAADYGTTNPTAFGLYGIGASGTVYKEREYYWDPAIEGKQKTDSEFSDAMAAFIGNIVPRAIIVDPSAESFQLQLKRDGFRNVINADNSVLDGIRTQSRMLTTGRYKVLERCKQTIADYGAYVWDSKAQERGEDKPIKKFDHTKDEERYLLHTLFGTERSVRTMSKRGLGL